MKSNNCTLEAFSIVTGIDYSELAQDIGHDGRAIVNPELPKPICFRGYHTQEIVDALWGHLFYVVEIQAMPTMASVEGANEVLAFDYYKRRIIDYIDTYNGVIVGKRVLARWRHAYAKLDGKIFDPDTGEETKLPHDFGIEAFYIVGKRSKHD